MSNQIAYMISALSAVIWVYVIVKLMNMEISLPMKGNEALKIFLYIQVIGWMPIIPTILIFGYVMGIQL